MNKEEGVLDFEIHEGMFEKCFIKFGRKLNRNTLSIGKYINEELEGSGRKVLPNFVIQEGVFKKGRIQNELKTHPQLKERWLNHFNDDFAIE